MSLASAATERASIGGLLGLIVKRLTHDRLALALGAIAALYLVVALLMPVDGFWSPDFGARYLTVTNLEWDSMGFSGPIPYPGRELDPAGKLVPLTGELPFADRPDGRFESQMGIWFPVLSWLPWKVLGRGGLIVLPLISGLAICLLAGLMAELWRPGRGWLAALITAGATPVAFYSQVFWDHAPAVALVLAGCYLFMRPSVTGTAGARQFRAYAAGLVLFLFAAMLRREMLVAQVCGAAWTTYRLARRGRSSVALAAANLCLGLVLIVIAQTAWWSAAHPLTALASFQDRLSNPAGLGRSGLLAAPRPAGPQPAGEPAEILTPIAQGPLSGALARAVGVVYNIDSGAALVDPVMGGLTAIATTLGIAAMLLPRRWKWTALALAAAAVFVPVIATILTGPGERSLHGVVLASPMVLAASAVALDSRGKPAAPLLWSLVVGFGAAQAVILGTGPSLGLEWGPRLVLLIYPLAAVVLATAWPPQSELTAQSESLCHSERSEESVVRVPACGGPHCVRHDKTRLSAALLGRTTGGLAVAVLLASAAAIQVRGLQGLRTDSGSLAAWTAQFERMPASVVVTDRWWLPLAVTPAYGRHQFLYVNSADKAEYLYRHVGQQRVIYSGEGGERIPLYLARYFESIGLERAQADSGLALWLVSLRPRPQPLEL